MIQQNSLAIIKFEVNLMETFVTETKEVLANELVHTNLDTEKHAFGVVDLWNITRKSKPAVIHTHPIEL
jgi:hypothetical protein